jgi:hypothetical protein
MRGDNLSRMTDGGTRVPSVDKVRGFLQKALREHDFSKITHVVTLVRANLMPQDPLSISLLADCYEAMVPPRPDVAQKFRQWASDLRPLTNVESKDGADGDTHPRESPSQDGGDTDYDADHVARADPPQGSVDNSGLFVVDRVGNRSGAHISDEQPLTRPEVPSVPEPDHESILAGLMQNLPDMLQRPGYSNLAALYEITTSTHSRPRYALSDQPDTPGQDSHGTVKAQCTVQLSLSPQLSGLISDEPVRGTASASTFNAAKNGAAEVVITKLETLAEKVRKAALVKFKHDLALRVSDWKSGIVAERCHDAFKNVRDIIVDADAAGIYGAKVRPYGSYAIGLAQEGSDLDVEVQLPRPDAKMKAMSPPMWNSMRVLNFLANKLVDAGLDSVTVVSARVPVIRCFDRERRIPIDITVSDRHSVVMSRLIRRHLEDDIRVWELAMFVKYWSQRRDIADTTRGYLNSIGWTNLALWFLQQLSPPVCSFFIAQNVSSRHDARDVIIRRVPWRANQKTGVNSSTTAELIGQFFQFYTTFDFKTSAVSLRYQEPVLRAEIDRMRSQPLFVENPLSPGVNIAAGVHSVNLRLMEREIRRARHSVINTGNIQHTCAIRSRKPTEL